VVGNSHRSRALRGPRPWLLGRRSRKAFNAPTAIPRTMDAGISLPTVKQRQRSMPRTARTPARHGLSISRVQFPHVFQESAMSLPKEGPTITRKPYYAGHVQQPAGGTV
jgi:hypothetical protein